MTEPSKTPPTVVDRITAYLTGGGLFNPELANHDAVRDLLIDARRCLSDTPRWVSVDERLPEMRRRSVLVFEAINANIYTAYLDEPEEDGESRWRFFGGQGGYVHGVTHWMPLPEAPK